MAIDILNIAPHEVSRDLSGYTVLFYGQPKTGKTTIASRFPDALLLAFEKGYAALPGVKAAPINRWSEFKQVLKQLKSDEAHALYKTIIVDTSDIAYDLCEKYICNLNEVSKIGDVPYGGGYGQAKKEFDEALRSVPQMGYGLVMISHAQDKTFTDEDGNEYNKIVPTLANQPRLVVDRMVDILGYARPVEDAEGNIKTLLFLRGTPRFEAGSRFKYTPEYIEFTYENLTAALNDAIDQQAAELNGKFVTDSREDAHDASEPLDFDALISEFNEMVSKLQSAAGADFGTKWAPVITEIVNKYLGKGKKVSDCSREQVEQLSLIVSDLEERIGNGI